MLLALLLAAETAKLPPWKPLPMADSAEGAVMAPINALLTALTARDGALMLAQTRPEGSATAVSVKADGTRAIRHQSWGEFVAGLKLGPARFEEKLSDPAIDIDGDIAMVWSPYSVFMDGKMLHCGVDHFDLVRENGAWKVLNLTFSLRTTGCEPAR